MDIKNLSSFTVELKKLLNLNLIGCTHYQKVLAIMYYIFQVETIDMLGYYEHSSDWDLNTKITLINGDEIYTPIGYPYLFLSNDKNDNKKIDIQNLYKDDLLSSNKDKYIFEIEDVEIYNCISYYKEINNEVSENEYEYIKIMDIKLIELVD